MSHTQRLGAVQNNSNGRQASVGSVGQKMVQVHSQDSRVGHANVLNSVMSGAQSLKIQKRKANESKLNPAVGGMSTNLNHSNLGNKLATRTFSQLDQAVRTKKVPSNQGSNLPSTRNLKPQVQRQVYQAKEHNNSYLKQADRRSSTTENTVRKSITNSVNSTAKRADTSKYLDNSASQSKQSPSFIEPFSIHNVHSITPDRIKLRRFHDKMQKGGVFEARVDQFDRKKFFDPQYVAEHANYIYEHCLDTESVLQPNPRYMVR